MTIKELEERTGMTRANIYFYEREGLLTPRRQDNGYRDYSEEDAVTLERIKLLRELHLDIDTIRLVQRGELTLEQALFSLRNRLEGDKATIDRAVEVCRQLEQSGLEYGALDPKPWLKELEQPRRPQLAQPVRYTPPKVEEPVDHAYDHPCKRILARWLDVLLHGIVVDAVLLLVLHSPNADWLSAPLSLAFAMICEPFWLHFWGWTPGKWVFGLKVRDYRGEKLTIGEGFYRVWRVFVYGYGCCLFVPVTLWCAWRFLQRYRNNQDSRWDEFSTYTCENRRLSGLLLLAGTAICLGLAVVMSLQFYMPPNRGDLTVAEFCENFNFYLDILSADGRSVDAHGRWVKPAAEPGVLLLGGGGAVPVNVALEYDGLTFAEEDGQVWAVTLSAVRREYPQAYPSYGEDYLAVGQDYCRAATLALAGARREFNCFNLGLEGWINLWEGQWKSFESNYRGIHISQSVEYAGYETVGDVGQDRGKVLKAVEGERQSYCRTVTISADGG